jgi:alcohol dehydrogenase, propanol-preferring
VTPARGWVFDPGDGSFRLRELGGDDDDGAPVPPDGQVRLAVSACGLCRTDLHILDGDLVPPAPVVLGHQIVGTVVAVGAGVDPAWRGRRVGVPWLGWTCGECRYCRSERENLCPRARFTGFDLPGGLATRCLADARFCLPLPEGYADLQVAPLLCAGLIGYRALRLAGEAERLGIYGFGAAAHVIAQVARGQGRRVFAFTRPGDSARQAFARKLGAVWAGDSTALPPEELDAAILFAAAGELVPAALRAVAPGGAVVCAEIHMTDIPSFPYQLLWKERLVRSVANLTRRDGRELLALAPQVPVATQVTVFPLQAADQAVAALRGGAIEGAVVVAVASPAGPGTASA